MKKKIVLSLFIVISLFIITGCGNSSNSSLNKNTNIFKIKDVSLVFDQDSEFYNFKYKNVKDLEPDESKQSVYLDYKNNDIYNGRFVFRISLSFSSETSLKDFLDGHKTEKVNINGINWEKVTISSKTDNKDTSAIVYATEKDSVVYVVSTIAFEEANINIEELSNIFINNVTLK